MIEISTNGVQLPLVGVSVESTPPHEAAPKTKTKKQFHKRLLEAAPPPAAGAGAGVLTADELAAYLDCSVRQVWKMSAERAIPSVRYGRWVRFDPAAVMAALTRKESR